MLKILLVALIGYSIYSVYGGSAAPSAKAIASAPTKTPSQLADEAKKERAFQRTAALAGALKRSLRDPDSLVWESIHANADASVACFAYRAKNGFGGMNREFVVYADGKASQKPADWNRKCQTGLTDMKHVRLAI